MGGATAFNFPQSSVMFGRVFNSYETVETIGFGALIQNVLE